MEKDDLMSQKGKDIKNTLWFHLQEYALKEIEGYFNNFPKTVATFITVVMISLSSEKLSDNGKLQEAVSNIVTGGGSFYLSIFAILLSTFAIFQAFLSRKFVQIAHETGKKNKADPLFNLGKQFLCLTAFSLLFYVISVVATIVVSKIFFPIMLEIFTIKIFQFLGFVFLVMYCLTFIMFVLDLFTMVYNLWKTLANYSVLVIYDRDDGPR